ncbi:MAG: Fe-S cluster assembly protein IscX [Phycisphaerae bacterium]
MPDLKWSDADEIGFLLSQKFPDTDPLSVRFTDLRDWVTQLEGFADKPDGSSEQILEAIQMAWLGYYKDTH